MPDKHEVGGSSPLGPTISLEEKSRETKIAVISYNPIIKVSLPAFRHRAEERQKNGQSEADIKSPTMKVSLLTFLFKESKCSLKTE